MKLKAIGLIITFCVGTQAVAEVDTPAKLFGQLFEDVQMQRVFPDGKTAQGIPGLIQHIEQHRRHDFARRVTTGHSLRRMSSRYR